MKVLDATVVTDLLTRPGDEEQLRRFKADRYAAPNIIDAEVLSAIRSRVLGGHFAPWAVPQALDELTDLPLVRHSHGWLLHRAWFHHRNISTYDGLYVALAEAFDAPLWTRDARLARAAERFVSVECP